MSALLGIDRRSRRSHVPETALERYLASVADRAGLDAIVLAEGTRVVGTSRSEVDLQRLAALGVVCSQGLEPADFDDVTNGRDLYTHAWTEAGRTFTLTTLGGRVTRLREVAIAIGRIADEIY